MGGCDVYLRSLSWLLPLLPGLPNLLSGLYRRLSGLLAGKVIMARTDSENIAILLLKCQQLSYFFL